MVDELQPRADRRWKRNLSAPSDPRQYQFAIMCEYCKWCDNTLGEFTHHLDKECPYKPMVDVRCGHCDLRFSRWNDVVRHLNQPGRHMEPACKPEYRMNTRPAVHFSPPSVTTPKTTQLATMASVTTEGGYQRVLTRFQDQDILALSIEAAGIRNPEIQEDVIHAPPRTPTPLKEPPWQALRREPEWLTTETIGADTCEKSTPAIGKAIRKKKNFAVTSPEIVTPDTGISPGKSKLVDTPVIVVTPTETVTADAVEQVNTCTLPLYTPIRERAGTPKSGLPKNISPITITQDVEPDSTDTEERLEIKQEVKEEVIDLTFSEDDVVRTKSPSCAKLAKLQSQVKALKEERAAHLRQLIYLADSVKNLGETSTYELTDTDKKARDKMVASGSWPESFTNARDLSSVELGTRLGDYYRGCLDIAKK